MRVRAPLVPLLLSAPLLLLAPLVAVPPAAADVVTSGAVRLVPGAPAVLRASGRTAPPTNPARRSALRASPRSSSATGATFVVSYSGFTTTQRDAFQAAVDTWERLLTSSVPIRIDARLDALPDGVLGSAGSTSFVVDDADGRYGPEDTLVPIALANALAGRDLDPSGPDISADFSNDTSLFSYGADPVAGRYDFTTVVLHEIAHGLGFAGAMDVVRDGAGVDRGYWDTGTTMPRPLLFDRSAVSQAVDGSTTALLSLPRGSAELGVALTGGRSQWDGAAGKAANGGLRPELYTPSAWEPGSSYSHLDEQTYPPGDPDALMTPALDLGEVVRDPGDIALGMLSDLGWGASTAALRLSGPDVADAGRTVAVTGVAPVGSVVQLYFKRRGSTETSPGGQPGYTLQRQLLVGTDGSFSTSFVANDDHRYYAQVGSATSEPVLTQVRPAFSGPATRVVRRGSTVALSGRGLPGTTLTLRFTRGTSVDVRRTVTVRGDGTWSRSQVLQADLRVAALGANGRSSASTVLLQAR